jgi:hypothetical protein
LKDFSESELRQFLILFEKLASNMEKMRGMVNEFKDERNC